MKRDDEAWSTLPQPTGHGWEVNDGQISPSVCDVSCAPHHILQLIRGKCVKSKS